MVFDTTMVCRQSGDRAPLEEQLPDEEIAALLAGLAAGRPFPPGGNLRPGEPFCSAGRSAARLTPSGRVTPCVALPGAAGSVRETSFADIWRSEAFEPLRRLRLEDLPRCRDCELRDWCVRCPGLALVDDGDVTGPSAAACRLARICAALSQHAAGTSPLRRGAPRAAGEEATADERP